MPSYYYIGGVTHQEFHVKMYVFYLFQLKEANTNPDMEMNISTHYPILPAIYPNQSPPIGICLCLLILVFVYPRYWE